VENPWQKSDGTGLIENLAMPYKAFISYSHAADGKLAPAIQHALHRIAKPWYRLRTMRVFRDQTNLGVSPGLWAAIESALQEAEFFLYLASPAAAQSPWVQKEVDWWLRNRSWQKFLIVLTDGAIAWDGAKQDLDWEVTTALPRQVANVFPEEPLYSDVRWARTVDQLSLRHSQFRAVILDLATTLLNRPKDELDGEDVRQHRRTRRIAWSGVIALTVLLVAALFSAFLATQQSRVATSRALAASSEAVLPTNPELALLLARESVRLNPDSQTEYALRQAFLRNPQRMIHHTHPGRVTVAEFAGSEFVVAAEPGKHAIVWSVATGLRVAELSVDAGDQLQLSQTSDRSLVAVPAGETSFAVYDGKSWALRATLPGTGARFSRDGKVLTAIADNEVRQWSVPSLEERNVAAKVPEGYVLRDVSPDGSVLFFSEEQEVSAGMIVQAMSGDTLGKIPRQVLREGTGFSPDGRILITERMDDSGMDLWNARTGRNAGVLEKPEFGDIGWTTHVTFSPDGKTFVSGNRNGDIHVWDVETRKWLGTLIHHRNDILRIKFSPDSRTMLSAAADGTACLWDMASARCIAVIGGKGDDVWDIDFATDTKHFLTTHIDGTVRVWDREVWYPDLTFPAEKTVVSEDGRLVVGAVRTEPVRVWDADSGKLKATLEASTGDVNRMALARRASLIAIAPDKGVVGLWNTQTGKRMMELGAASAKTTALAFSPAGSFLATGTADGNVRFWSMRDGSLLSEWKASQDAVTDILFLPNEKSVIVSTWDGWVRVRDRSSGEILLETKLDEEGSVPQGVALNAGGNLLLVVGDKFPQVWDLNARVRIRTLAGHTDEVYGGAFSLDGRFLLTASGYMHARGEPPADGNAVRLWDVQSGRQLLSYQSAQRLVRTVAFANNGQRIFAGSDDGMVRRYACEVCLPLPGLIDLLDTRTARALSAEERARYMPEYALASWIARRLPSAYGGK